MNVATEICTFCGKGPFKLRNLRMHESYHCKGNSKSLPPSRCEVCGTRFGRPADCGRHRRLRHKAELNQRENQKQAVAYQEAHRRPVVYNQKPPVNDRMPTESDDSRIVEVLSQMKPVGFEKSRAEMSAYTHRCTDECTRLVVRIPTKEDYEMFKEEDWEDELLPVSPTVRYYVPPAEPENTVSASVQKVEVATQTYLW